MPDIKGPVGVRNRKQQVQNDQKDQSTIIHLLMKISTTLGGRKGHHSGDGQWASEPPVGWGGYCPETLAKGILEFQEFWKRKGEFRTVDGVVDPGGTTLRKLNELAGYGLLVLPPDVIKPGRPGVTERRSGPIELGFGPGESLSTINSFAIGVGVAFGSVTLPYRVVDFDKGPAGVSFDDLKTNEAKWRRKEMLPPGYHPQFWAAAETVRKPVGGLVLGVDGSPVSAIKEAFSAVRSALKSILTGIGADILQSSTSSPALIRTIPGQGRDTWNLPIDAVKQWDVRVFQVGVGAVAATAGNLVCFGTKFPSATPYMLNLNALNLVQYFARIASNTIACAWVQDAAVGVIVPGASIQLLDPSLPSDLQRLRKLFGMG